MGRKENRFTENKISLGWNTERRKGFLPDKLKKYMQMKGVRQFKGHQPTGFQQSITPQVMVKIV